MTDTHYKKRETANDAVQKAAREADRKADDAARMAADKTVIAPIFAGLTAKKAGQKVESAG